MLSNLGLLYVSQLKRAAAHSHLLNCKAELLMPVKSSAYCLMAVMMTSHRDRKLDNFIVLLTSLSMR